VYTKKLLRRPETRTYYTGARKVGEAKEPKERDNMGYLVVDGKI
jgi:hypothetical protein